MFLHSFRTRKCFCRLSVLSFVACLVYYHSFIRKVARQPFDLPYVVFHLDFKGAPPKLSYLSSILGVLREHGANGLLMEYEDMFPFDKPLQHLSARNAYSRDELKEFVSKAVQLGFVIIPLVQTFGHMQYVLEHAQHETLRESAMLTDSICPSQPQSKALIEDILTQIIQFHSNIRPLNFLHIGCDEVYTINSCQYCKQRNTTDIEIFRDHVQFVYKTVQRITPDTEVLIWDDMLRGKKEELLNPKRLPIDLVSWHYHTNVDVSYIDLYKYKKNFHSVWAASAFKGADGDESLMPNLVNRIRNHFSWMRFLEKYTKLIGQPKPNFRGIILTGWSRYHHTAPVCDMLPASLPSLIINLMVIKKFNTQFLDSKSLMTWSSFYDHQLKADVSKALFCDVAKEGINYINGHDCLFQGNDLNVALKSFRDFQQSINDHKVYIDEILKRKLVNNSDFKYFKDVIIKRIDIMKLTGVKIERHVQEAMTNYFDDYVIESYLRQIFAPTKTLLNSTYHAFFTINNVSITS